MSANFSGTSGDDRYWGGEGASRYILGNEGDDVLSGETWALIDQANSIQIADEFQPYYTVTSYAVGSDVIDGGAGHDTIHGDSTNTTVGSFSGGSDNSRTLADDTLYGGDGNDNLYGDSFILNTTFNSAAHGGFAQSAPVNVDLYAGNDRLTGGSGNDSVYGDAIRASGGFCESNGIPVFLIL